jgi:Arc/MetJ-type ribon-helix-helix transcriptional regulator
MERTQISLTSEQAERLRRVARKRGTSMAALIREAVDRVVPDEDTPTHDERWDRAMRVVGAFHSGGGNVAKDHDRYLDEIYGEKVDRRRAAQG